jgi:Zn-dependent protease with chaperone function
MENGATVLGLDKLPELYIEQSPQPNAYTFGADEHFIVVTTALLDLVNEQELESVLAHELAHVHCDHVLYKTAARILSSLAVDFAGRFFGLAGSVIYPVIYGLLYWDRASELSADRAELLVNHNPETSLILLLKLAGGSQSSSSQLDIEAFRRQAREVQELSENNWLLKAYLIIQEANSTHHFATWRAQKMDQWADSGQALHLMAGQPPEGESDTESSQTQRPEQNEDPEQEPIGIGDILAEFRRMFGLESSPRERPSESSSTEQKAQGNINPDKDPSAP